MIVYMKTKEEVLEMHFGSEYYLLKENNFLRHILNAMNEYADQFKPNEQQGGVVRGGANEANTTNIPYDYNNTVTISKPDSTPTELLGNGALGKGVSDGCPHKLIDFNIKGYLCCCDCGERM